MALSDFWQILDHQVFDGKPFLNVYQVKRILAGADADDVSQGFINSIVELELLALQPTGVGRTTIDVANLGDVTDFVSIDSSSLPGQLVGDPLPGFNAATLQFNRTRTDMRNGAKRFCVGQEGNTANGIWSAGFQTSLTSLLTALLNPWEASGVPGVDICELVIMKRFCVDPLEDPCTIYRLPNTSAEADANHYVPTLGVVRPRVRSQVSRKVL